MNKNIRGGFKWLVGAVAGVSLLGACGAPGESAETGAENAQAAAGEISATVTAAKASLAAREDVSVTVTLTNTSSRTVSLLKWYVPGGDLKEGLLSVSRDGQPVDYIGAHYKRVAPTAADYVQLAPGESISGTVRVSDAYDLSQSGTYTIGYDLGDEAGRAGVSAFKSNEVSLFVEGRLSSLQLPAEGTVHAASLSYSSCTSTRQTTISSAVSNALTYSTNAYNYLNTTTPGNTARYKTWFGSYTSTNWSTAKSHYSAIKNAFASAAIVVDCTCTDTGTYAYVYPTQPYKIYVCGAFWNAPMTGTDSKAGTLVHEMSHFNVVASTDDWAYGQTAAKNLAISSPTKALDNADNHEYFAENNPAQN